MANFEWTFDAPSGVYKNNALSADRDWETKSTGAGRLSSTRGAD